VEEEEEEEEEVLVLFNKSNGALNRACWMREGVLKIGRETIKKGGREMTRKEGMIMMFIVTTTSLSCSFFNTKIS